MPNISIIYAGDIAEGNAISLRTISKTFPHVQNAFDRAYLEQRYGHLRKHVKLRREFYADLEITFLPPREGSYIADFNIRNRLIKPLAESIGAMVSRAFDRAMEEGVEQAASLSRQAETRLQQIQDEVIEPLNYQESLVRPDPNIVNSFGERAVVREINELLSVVRSEAAGDSQITLEFSHQRTYSFEFDRVNAEQFSSVVKEKKLGLPVIYEGTVKALSKRNMRGQFKHESTNSISNLAFVSEQHLNTVIPYFRDNRVVRFYGCPYIEYGAFDSHAGDIYFIGFVA